MSLITPLRTLIFGLCLVDGISFSILRLPTRIPLRPGAHLRRPALLQTYCTLKIQTPLVKVEGYAAIRDILGGLPITGGYSSIFELFNKFDKDLSGKIEPVELQQTMREMGVALTDDQVCIFTWFNTISAAARLTSAAVAGVAVPQDARRGRARRVLVRFPGDHRTDRV